MENMFNNISRAQCRRIILRHFLDLTSAFDSIYQTRNIIYYQTSDDAIHTIVQKEGWPKDVLGHPSSAHSRWEKL
eukprot:4032549-Ditylum_brightwellii.AAC.1